MENSAHDAAGVSESTGNRERAGGKARGVDDESQHTAGYPPPRVGAAGDDEHTD